MKSSTTLSQVMSDDFIRQEILKYKWFAHTNFGNGIIAQSTAWPDAPFNSKHMGTSKFDYIIKPNLPDLQGKRILEIGCNNGINAIHMSRLGAQEVVGVDSDVGWPDWKKQAEFVKTALEWRCGTQYNIKYIEKNMKDIPSLDLGKFDIVIALNCIYYIEEEEIEKLMTHVSTISNLFLIQCNTRDQGALGRRPTPGYIKDALQRNGFPDTIVDAPWEWFAGKRFLKRYCRPVVVGKKS